MCGAQFWIKTPTSRYFFLWGRFLSYTLSAGAFGYFGQSLLQALELEILRFVSFLVFLIVAAGLLATWWGVQLPFSKAVRAQMSRVRAQRFPSFLQGLCSVALPCSTIFQMLSLSLLSASLAGGLLIGFTYAMTTGLTLWLGARVYQRLETRLVGIRRPLRLALAVLVFWNSLQFAAKIYAPNFEKNLSPLQRTLLCF